MPGLTHDDLIQIRKDAMRSRYLCTEYIQKCLENYEAAASRRRELKIPVVAFCGHGRAGKDQVAEFMGAYFNVRYNGSNSRWVTPLIAEVQDKSEQEVWETRHNNRMYWFHFCNYLREYDPTFVLRLSLGEADIAVGSRAWHELSEASRIGVINIPVWVNRLNTPIDPTLEYDQNAVATLPGYQVLQNYSDLANLKSLAIDLGRKLNLPRRELNPNPQEATSGNQKQKA